ncbi:Methionine aminopeptidase 2 [Mycena venus]|uniref:2,5-diamino-6-ribosylamino-4(3H)-pyrimidinone 5'-phosphate reductase n=1 Tax=Mycena venus TaxID=2733690 RepID=A0A8H6XW19_9AGAR|nr:Methionine aminopeptidase 2 [Mycena venus]
MAAIAPDYLTALLAPYTATDPSTTRPFVTLTFAQSLDGKIAGAGGKQLALSGKESMVMTHWLRTLHDAILVGSGTALNDDPQLNTRHLPPLPPDSPPYPAPRPIILDTRLRLPSSCKLLKNYANGKGTGRRPWVVSCAPRSQDAEWDARRQALERAGARVLLLPSDDESGRIQALLSLLCAEGIRSLMVEGGAQIISAFFDVATECVDTVLITTAPLIVGAKGVGFEVPGENGAFRVAETRLVGRDSVVALVAAPPAEAQ